MKIIIAGGREFWNSELVADTMKPYLENPGLVIVCGMARGADLCGKQWADNNNIPVEEYPADWNRYGKRAGYLRNEAMSREADILVAFWDGKSKGTFNMINIMKKANKEVIVINYQTKKPIEESLW